MSQYTHERIRNLSPVSSISLALLFFYFIIIFNFFGTNKITFIIQNIRWA